ncbi:hypothetical protein A1A1_14709, partial [Planococcus antarcticus DSM 14505]
RAAFIAASLGCLMTQRASRWSLDNKEKRKQPCSHEDKKYTKEDFFIDLNKNEPVKTGSFLC